MCGKSPSGKNPITHKAHQPKSWGVKKAHQCLKKLLFNTNFNALKIYVSLVSQLKTLEIINYFGLLLYDFDH